MKRALSLVVVASVVGCSSSGSGTSGPASATADTTGGTNSGGGGSGGAPSNSGGASSGGRPNGGSGGALEGTSGGAPTTTSDGGPADSGGIEASDALSDGSSRGSFASGSWDKDPRLEPPSTLGDCDLGGAATQNVAVLPDGTAFGAWECNEGGSHVYASRFVPGSGWSTPVVLSAEPLYTIAIALAVAASATGNAVVAWSDTVLGDGGYRFVIRAAHFGSTWEPEVTISSPAYSAYYATGFSLHADAHGDFLAAWDEISAAPSAVPTPAWELPAHPGVARYDHATGWSAAFEPEEPDSGASLWPIPNVWSIPAVAMDADGNAIVAWSDSLRSISGQSGFVRADRYTNDKGWMGTESAATVANPLTPIQPSVAIDGAGNAVVAWMEGQQRPYASTFHGTWSAAALAAASGYADEQGPLVATDTHGGFLAVFSEHDSVSADLYASRLEIPGSWSSPQKLDAPVSTDADGSPKNLDGGSAVAHEFESSSPALAMNENGDALVTWARTNGISQSIQAIAFSTSSGWGTPLAVLSGLGSDNGSLLIDSRGDGMLISSSFSPEYALSAVPYLPAAGWGSRVTISSTQAQLGGFSAAMNASGEVATLWTLDRNGRSAEVVEGAVYR